MFLFFCHESFTVVRGNSYGGFLLHSLLMCKGTNFLLLSSACGVIHSYGVHWSFLVLFQCQNHCLWETT